MLYHTVKGTSLVSAHPECVGLIKEVYNPLDLGVVSVEDDNTNMVVLDFIKETISMGMGFSIENRDNKNKPINLLPILNLQNDIGKLQKNGQEFLIGENICDYLTSINIFINSECNNSCIHCSEYYRQTLFCTRFSENEYLSTDTIENILSQSLSTQVKRINILGGDLTLHPEWLELLNLFRKFSFDYHLWLNITNIDSFDEINRLPFNKVIVVSSPFDSDKVIRLINSTQTSDNLMINFVVENEAHIETITKLRSEYGFDNYRLIPFYNRTNMEFFGKNVFLNKSDILTEPIEMRQIFCNQKLNSNFFGVLNFFPDGTVKACSNTPSLGKFPERTLLELIYEELVTASAWRKVRDDVKCNNCFYRYLCPPPGNLEFVLGRNDLCHINF